MLHIDMVRLARIGLDPQTAEAAGRLALLEPDRALWLGRVTAVHRETVQWHDGDDERGSRPLPRLVRELADAGSALTVGDWALAVRDVVGGLWLAARVPPRTHIVRRDGDGTRHAVVSNIDVVVVVMGLDDDFNLRRLERYLSIAHAAGTPALVALTKADVAAADPVRLDARLAALTQRLSVTIEPIVIDATDPRSADRFAPHLAPGRTLVLLGSSGAGKSTLTNTLLGEAVQDTGAVRVHDSRGMHTTTGRTLHLLPGGACIIDTPGVRTLRADVDEAQLAASFEDVAALARRCRFRDCTHGGEPGCAVQAGVDADRLRNYQKLLRETRRDTLSHIEKRQQLSAWKSRGKATRARMKIKRGEA